jgi:predicted metal-dependent phosphoesterase TrpH
MIKGDFIDLHTHSNRSDGSYSPRELILAAKEADARAIALTDHDTVDGLKEARMAANEVGLEFVNGIEISAEFSPGTMHILGYYVEPHSEALGEKLVHLRGSRDMRNPAIAARLQQLGFDVTIDEVTALAGSEVVGRPHFARVMLEKGYVASIQDAFDRYLAKGASAYVEKGRLSPKESIDLIHESGGVAVLAHPYQLKCKSQEETGAIMDELAGLGLDGVEAIYSRHSPEQRARYSEMARERGMLTSGGSDFHGTYKPDLSIVTGKSDLRVPYSLLEALKDRANALRREGGVYGRV